MTRITDEDLRAFQKEYGPSLLAYFARRVEPREDAAALLNELLEIMWRKSASVPTEPEAARMWMFGIARNLVLTHRRGAARRSKVIARLRDELSNHHEPIENDDVIAVRQAVAALPELQRELVRLVHWDGFTLAAAATITGVAASTARGRYQAARTRLARELSATADPDPAVVSIAVGSVCFFV
jgi:RNA polymerase sigma-70 factor (ECF subfamily)